jgi:hypothetical protein
MKRIVKRLKSKKHLNESSGQSVQPTDSDHAPSEAILAFRTITTMLSLIQSPTETIISGKNKNPDDQRRELKVLDVFSAVAVRQHEIVAVTAKRDDGPNLPVLISVNNLESEFDISQQQQQSESSRAWHPLRWFITPNPRDAAKNPGDEQDSLTTQSRLITLVDPNLGISSDLSMASPDKLLNTFLETEW